MSQSTGDTWVYRNDESVDLSKSTFQNASTFDPLADDEPLELRLPLCGVPGVCSTSASENCRNITLNDCQDCSKVISAIFVVLVLCLGLAILVGNCLIISVSFYLTKKGKVTKVDGYKTSLAIADSIMGFQIMFVTLPNFVTASTSTFDEILPQLFSSRNSAAAVVGGITFLLSFTSSLYHLLLLGVSRLYAIKWPLHYRKQSPVSYYSGIVVIWVLAVAVSTVPAWFPDAFNYDYNHIGFLYIPTASITETRQFNDAASAMLILLILVPYVLMTVLMISTVVLARFELQTRRRKVTVSNAYAIYKKREISTFKTVAIMQISFTFTLVPLAVVIGLFSDNYIRCHNISTPYLVALYVSMTSSLVNVLVYSIRDDRFRSAVCEMLKNMKMSVCKEDLF